MSRKRKEGLTTGEGIAVGVATAATAGTLITVLAKDSLRERVLGLFKRDSPSQPAAVPPPSSSAPGATPPPSPAPSASNAALDRLDAARPMDLGDSRGTFQPATAGVVDTTIAALATMVYNARTGSSGLGSDYFPVANWHAVPEADRAAWNAAATAYEAGGRTPDAALAALRLFQAHGYATPRWVEPPSNWAAIIGLQRASKAPTQPAGPISDGPQPAPPGTAATPPPAATAPWWKGVGFTKLPGLPFGLPSDTGTTYELFAAIPEASAKTLGTGAANVVAAVSGTLNAFIGSPEDKLKEDLALTKQVLTGQESLRGLLKDRGLEWAWER